MYKSDGDGYFYARQETEYTYMHHINAIIVVLGFGAEAPGSTVSLCWRLCQTATLHDIPSAGEGARYSTQSAGDR